MIISVLIKKGDSYVGKGFLELKDEINGVVSEDELYVYLNETGQIEQTVVLPNGNDENGKKELTVVGFLAQIEANAKKLTEGDDESFQFGNGVIATIKKIRDFFQGRIKVIA